MHACRSSARQKEAEGSSYETSLEDELAKLDELQNQGGKKKPKGGAKSKRGVKPTGKKGGG